MTCYLATATLGLAVLTAAAISVPASANDLIDCSVTVRKSSEAACTRIINAPANPKTDRFMAYYNRAWYHLRQGALDKALSDFNAAEQLDRNFSKLYLSRAQVKRELNDFTGALLDLDVYVVFEPRDWSGHYQRAEVARRLGQPKVAIAALDKSLAQKPYEAVLKPLRVLLLSDLGRHSEAVGEADQLVAARPRDPVSRYVRAVISFRRNAFENALSDIKAALKQQALFPAAHTLRAQILELRGDVGEAKNQYRQALISAGPAIDQETAEATARLRLDVLENQSTARVALRDKSQSVFAQGNPAENRRADNGIGDCRRYIPSAAATVPVPCGK
ncbi:MAG: hypothetical protein APF80_07055 [Alphaproteobacteria bacterium BRH_c36]|nr:MAG: hypothetical protein APF80_07055 [Alphaproteobacteria bacterium BRH_c36]